jgi:hypothetical protein
MDPVTMMLIGGGVQVGAGLIGSFLGGAQDEKALEYRKKALAEYMGISVPELEELHAKEQGDTELRGVQRDAGQDALMDESQARLSERARTGGWDAQARESYAQGEMDAATYERGQREALASRFQPGDGAGAVLQAQAQQSGADRAAASGRGAAADAERRAMEAILQGGSFAMQRSGQQWDQDAQVASAQDRINEFNTATANNFTLANADERARHFDQRMRLADSKASAQEGMASHYEGKGQQARSTAGGLGQAAGYGLAAYGMYGATAPQQGPSMTTTGASAGVAPSIASAQANPYGRFTNRRKVG